MKKEEILKILEQNESRSLDSPEDREVVAENLYNQLHTSPTPPDDADVITVEIPQTIHATFIRTPTKLEPLDAYVDWDAGINIDRIWDKDGSEVEDEERETLMDMLSTAEYPHVRD